MNQISPFHFAFIQINCKTSNFGAFDPQWTTIVVRSTCINRTTTLKQEIIWLWLTDSPDIDNQTYDSDSLLLLHPRESVISRCYCFLINSWIKITWQEWKKNEKNHTNHVNIQILVLIYWACSVVDLCIIW